MMRTIRGMTMTVLSTSHENRFDFLFKCEFALLVSDSFNVLRMPCKRSVGLTYWIRRAPCCMSSFKETALPWTGKNVALKCCWAMWLYDCGSEIYLMPLPTNEIVATRVQVLLESPSRISNKFLNWLQCLENTGQGNAHVYIYREVCAH